MDNMQNNGMNNGMNGAGNMPNNGMNGGMNGNWQPQPQPQMMRPPKPPMDPAKKKKLILGISLGAGGVVIAIIAIVVVVILSKVDYGETYRLTKKLEDKVDDISYNYACNNVTSYVKSAYTSTTTYDGYANECLATMDGVEDLVAQVAETPGVKRNKELKQMFESFRTELAKILPNQEELAARLEMYKTWHKFAVLVDDLGTSSSDAEIQTAANVLIDSGNEVFKNYGEGWLEKTLAYLHAYQTYYNTSYSAANKSELRVAMENAKTAKNDYVTANKPDIDALGGLDFDDTSAMKRAFETFNNEVITLYQENYDSGSGDCVELFGEVVCE